MLFEDLGEQRVADGMYSAVKQVTTKLESLAAGRMGHSTSEVGDLVVGALG